MRLRFLAAVTAAVVLAALLACAWRASDETAAPPPPREEEPAPTRTAALPDMPEIAAPELQAEVTDSRQNAIVRAIQHAAPAVVSINVKQIQRQRVLDPFYQDFFDLFLGGGRGAPRYRIGVREFESVGSGFIFDPDGHILTNYHVIEGADVLVSVTLPDGRSLDVDLVGSDPLTDLAVLRARGGDLPHVPLGTSRDLLIGEWAIAIGNPFGLLMSDSQPSVSVGVISAKDRRVKPDAGPGDRLYQDMIQTDAAINPGNSGGPLVNAAGEVIGVNTMIFSQSGGNVGLGFAIPVDRAKRVVSEILQYGRRRNPWAGFKVEDIHNIDPVVLQRLGVSTDAGSMIVSIVEGCPAQRAGLAPGDVITAINGRKILQAQDVDYAIWSLFVGEKAEVDYDRAGRSQRATFLIEEIGESGAPA